MNEPPFTSAAIDGLCVAFERAWYAGENPRLENQLPAEGTQETLFRELLLVELELRRSGGQTPLEIEYRERFPQFHQTIREAFASPVRSEETKRLGDYDILHEIGKGGMGIVYQARQRSCGRLVALKVVRPDVFEGLAWPARIHVLERFRTEARAAARLQHPNVVEVFDVDAAEGQNFFAMRLVDGGTLEDLLIKGPLPGRQAAELLEPLARAIQHAHERGVLHRDLKPRNILLGKDGRPSIADFGLAKCLEDTSGVTLSGQCVGTPAYMAPEQAEGKSATIASDIYGLGATLYATLTGRPPFSGSSAPETLHQVLYTDPPAPRKLIPTIERDLEIICQKCLDKEPSRRYATATALAEDLQRFLGGETIRARTTSWPVRLGKWARRKKAVAFLLLSLVLAVVMGLAGFLSMWWKAEVALESAEATLYANYVVRAKQQWMANDAAEASLLLDLAAAISGNVDRRGWEWYHLRKLLSSERFTLKRHSDWALSTAYSPDGRWLVTGGGDATHSTGVGELFVWDTERGSLSYELPGHRWPVVSVSFSPDGTQLASVGTESPSVPRSASELFLWDMKERRLQAKFSGPLKGINAVAFAPNGRTVAAGGVVGDIVLWDVHSGSEIQPRQHLGARVSALAWFPEGGGMVAAADGCPAWVLEPGQPPRRLSPISPSGRALAIRPDGRVIAAVERDLIRLLNRDGSGEVGVFRGHTGEVLGLAWHPKGQIFASASADQTVRLWDARSGRELRVLRGHHWGLRSVAFHPDGNTLATASQDGTVKIWDAHRDLEALRLTNPAEILGGDVTSLGLTFAPDGQRAILLRYDGMLRTWELANGTLLSEVQRLPRRHLRWPFHEGTFAQGGRLLAVVSSDNLKEAQIWDTTHDKATTTFRGHDQTIRALALSPDGEILATAASEGLRPGGPTELKLWDATQGRELRSWQVSMHTVNQLAFDATGKRLATAGHKGHLYLWDTRGKALQDFSEGDDCFSTVAFSPNGRLLAAGSYEFGNVRIWDVQRGRKIATLKMPKEITHVLFNPDGRRLAAVNMDLVKLWETTTWHELLILSAREKRDGDLAFNARIAFSADGRRLAWTSWDHSVNVADSN